MYINLVTTHRNVLGDNLHALGLGPFESKTTVINLPTVYARKFYEKHPLVRNTFKICFSAFTYLIGLSSLLSWLNVLGGCCGLASLYNIKYVHSMKPCSLSRSTMSINTQLKYREPYINFINTYPVFRFNKLSTSKKTQTVITTKLSSKQSSFKVYKSIVLNNTQ